MTQPPPESVTQDHWVYICRSADGRILYVGVTSRGLARFAHGHSKKAIWWSEVANIEIEHHPTRRAALLREKHLIIDLAPLHNDVHTGGVTHQIPSEAGPERWLSTEDLADWLSADPEWIEAKIKEGMPHVVLAGALRFQAEEVRAWLQK